MIVTKTIDLTCGDSPIEKGGCTNRIIQVLETRLNVKLFGRTETDTVEGHIEITHTQNAHKIRVVIYDKDNEHESQGRNRTLIQNNSRVRRMNNFPSRQSVEDFISPNATIPFSARVRNLLRINP